MTLTPKELTAKEDEILDKLEHSSKDKTFRDRLYRDGVPTPSSYLRQTFPVLFVFREPNMRGSPYALDMRDEVRDEEFRPLRNGARGETSSRGWWNNKVGLFAHAVAAALDNEPEAHSFREFTRAVDEGEWNHDVVNRFAYIQIKKIGGGGSCKPDEICAYAEKYSNTLRDQINLYRPVMIIGCGVGKASPAQLLASHVVPGGHEEKTSEWRATWWRFPTASRPRAMLQLYHPSTRGSHGSRCKLYHHVWISVREVARRVAHSSLVLA